MKLLLVEDETELSTILRKGLKKYGYAVDAAYDGAEALDFYALGGYDVIILDLNLPKVDGLEVLRRIRQRDNITKILILSARSAVSDRVTGLDSGANDYMIKPFDFQELEARIRSLTRIAYVQHGNELTCGGLMLNMSAKTVLCQNNIVPLTKKEYAILEYMLLHKGEVVTNKQFLDHMWESDADLYPDTLKYHVHALKKRLSEAGCGAELIKNVRGIGYMMGETAQ